MAASESTPSSKAAWWILPLVVSPVTVLAYRLGGIAWGGVAVVSIWAAIYGFNRWRAWRWRRRVEALTKAQPSQIAAALESMDEDELALLRFDVGAVVPAHLDARAQRVRVFRYPRQPRWLLLGFAVFSLLFALVPTLCLLTRNVRADQIGSARLVAILFTLGGAALVWGARAKPGEVRVGVSGVKDIPSFGRARAIAWRELETVRWRRVPSSLILQSADRRTKIVVWPTLEHFPQFVEALTAEAMTLMEQRPPPDVSQLS